MCVYLLNMSEIAIQTFAGILSEKQNQLDKLKKSSGRAGGVPRAFSIDSSGFAFKELTAAQKAMGDVGGADGDVIQNILAEESNAD